MPKSGAVTSNASIPYLMGGRNLGSFCGVEVGECIIVNHLSKPRLLTDYRDRVAAEGALSELFAQTRCRHAIADDDQGFTHDSLFRTSWAAGVATSRARGAAARKQKTATDGRLRVPSISGVAMPARRWTSCQVLYKPHANRRFPEKLVESAGCHSDYYLFNRNLAYRRCNSASYVRNYCAMHKNRQFVTC